MTEPAPADRLVRVAGVDLVSVPRVEFLSARWDYSAGQHVTLLGPNGTGKTTLALQLMQYTTRPELPGVMLVMKPRDSTVDKWSKALGYKKVKTWPPRPTVPGMEKPNGWTLWPDHSFNPDRDDAVLRMEFRKAILGSYKKGDRVLFCDEVYGAARELGLERELVTVWSRGRSMGCGLWSASQRPALIPLSAYSEAEHLFLHNTPEKRARERYDDIGGVDPGLIRDVVGRLPRHWWLYVRRAGPQLCLVEP